MYGQKRIVLTKESQNNGHIVLAGGGSWLTVGHWASVPNSKDVLSDCGKYYQRVTDKKRPRKIWGYFLDGDHLFERPLKQSNSKEADYPTKIALRQAVDAEHNWTK